MIHTSHFFAARAPQPARAAAATAFHMQREQLLLTDLPAELVQHIVVRLTLAHDIARAAPTCKVVSVAAHNAFAEKGLARQTQ